MRWLDRSATAMRSPSGDQATPCGLSNCPVALLGRPEPITKSTVPLAWNTWTRLFCVSATAMRVPSGDQAGDATLMSCPVALPSDGPPVTLAPNAYESEPLPAWNTWMRPWPRSAVAIREPLGDQATACGRRNSPGPSPCDPTTRASERLAVSNTLMKLP